MKNAGTVLMYNCSGEEFSKLKQIFAMLRLRMRPVESDRYHLSLDDLSHGVGDPAEPVSSLPETMLVFCGMGQALLNQVLEIIRISKLPPISLKAVLTDANRSWNTMQLYEELLKEREAIAVQKTQTT